MSEALAMTVEYLKTRKQFGVTIGSFQALQHRASDMVVALEQARSMMYLATMSVAEENAEQRAKPISAAKVQIGRSAKFIGQQAVQMHGGIAMTYEYKVGHLFKRLTMIDAAYGDADLHIRRLGDRARCSPERWACVPYSSPLSSRSGARRSTHPGRPQSASTAGVAAMLSWRRECCPAPMGPALRNSQRNIRT